MDALRPPTALELASEHVGRPRVAIWFSVKGDLRFLSHHDQLRMLARALTRAGWPLAYSRGFNPQPRLWLPLPRSVGTASDCERALVELSESRPAERLYRSLARALPPTYNLQRVVVLATRAKPHPRRTAYTVELEPEHAGQAAARIAEVLSAEELTIERMRGPGRPTRVLDIRPCIETLTLDDRTLFMQLAFVAQRTARPTEVLTALHLPATSYNHRVRRIGVEWDIEFAGPTQWPASTERNNVGQEEDGDAQTQERVAQEESQSNTNGN
jgi:radical SAM-linked protein